MGDIKQIEVPTGGYSMVEYRGSLKDYISQQKNGIESIEEFDFNGFSTEDYSESFSEIKGSISRDEYSAQNGKVVNISDKYADYWTDNPLRFIEDSKTGSYRIEQLDSNGNWVAMGWTTREVAAEYANKISEIASNKDVETSSEKHQRLQQEAMDKKQITQQNATNYKVEIPKQVFAKLMPRSFNDTKHDENTIYRKFSDGTILSFDKEGKFIKIIETGTTDLDNKNSITDITNLQPEVKPLDEDNTFDDFDDFI